jgi:hypothetical protein
VSPISVALTMVRMAERKDAAVSTIDFTLRTPSPTALKSEISLWSRITSSRPLKKRYPNT